MLVDDFYNFINRLENEMKNNTSPNSLQTNNNDQNEMKIEENDDNDQNHEIEEIDLDHVI